MQRGNEQIFQFLCLYFSFREVKKSSPITIWHTVLRHKHTTTHSWSSGIRPYVDRQEATLAELTLTTVDVSFGEQLKVWRWQRWWLSTVGQKLSLMYYYRCLGEGLRLSPTSARDRISVIMWREGSAILCGFIRKCMSALTGVLSKWRGTEEHKSFLRETSHSCYTIFL